MNPEKIGKYTVIELLGRGGMGEVYLGEDPYIGRRVAIKMIKGADPDARDRFVHEARVIGGLAHPAIVSLLDFDFSGDEPFLVMEYLKGEGLDAWIQNPHSLSEQMVVLDDLCQALAYAHDNGVLHRDVKPSNVQVLPNGHAKLMDFGIARGSGGKLTATGAVVGTPEYMAPEILNDAAYSVRSDLFSCAVLLYEMFTGGNPFTAKSVAASLTNVLTLDPPHLHAVRPELPERLCDVVMACLRKAPELRPDGLGALIEAGREAVGRASAALPETRALPQKPAGPPSTARAIPAPGPAPPPKAFLRRLAGLTGAAAIIGLVWAVGRSGPPPTASVRASPSPPPVEAASGTGRLPVTPSATPAATPTPPAPAIPAARATAHVRSPRPELTGGSASVPPSTTGPASTPSPTSPATAAPSQVAAISEPTPAPRLLPTTNPPPAPSPSLAAVAPPPAPSPTLSSVSPRTVRRGSSVVLEVAGRDLRADLKALVLQGRRPAAGIKVVKQEFMGPTLFRVTILIEPEVPLLAYTVVLRDQSGASTPGVQIEVVL